jgi:hypothetical protein
MLVQEFLKKHSFSSLRATYGVNARPSADGSKWSLNYDQLSAKPGCPVADTCRGLVLRPATTVDSLESIVGDTVVMARPMDRFFNAGDSVAAKIDWTDPSIRVQEKLDGTLTILYFDSIKIGWCVATRSVSQADVSFGDPPGSPLNENTFGQLFFYSVAQTIDEIWGGFPLKDFFDGLNKNWTYIYELTTPLNRVVVKYNKYRVTLLAARDTATGEYVTDQVRYEQFLCRPSEWPLKSLSDLTAFVDAADPAKVEGAVVIDGNNNRVKVKSKAWVLASRAKDMITMSKRNALRAIIDGTITNVLPLLDLEVVNYIEGMQKSFNIFCKEIDADFKLLKTATPDRKAFALAVSASGLWAMPFFNLYSGKYENTLDWLQELCKSDKITDTTLDTILGYL